MAANREQAGIRGGMALTSRQLLGNALSRRNRVEILRNGDEIFPALLEAVDAAKHTVEFCTYVYWRGEIAERFADALIGAAERGVAVRVVLDAFGALRMPRRIRRRLQESDCRVCWFRPFHWWLPFNNHRTHRKLLICDNRIGFTGGVGISEEWTGDARNPCEWRETHFRIRGQLVADLRAAFLDNWLEVRADDVPPALPLEPEELPEDYDHPAGLVAAMANNRWSRVATLLHGVIARCQERLDICSPYFVPDRRLTRALVAAARRGVRIRILTASGRHSDSIASYLAGARHILPLLRAGVRIYQFLPTFIHTKVVLADGLLSIAGSSNVNQRSLKKDDEASFVCLDESVCAELTAHFEEDLARSREISPERFRGRSWLARVGELLIRPLKESV